jgi:hypothetical protein
MSTAAASSIYARDSLASCDRRRTRALITASERTALLQANRGVALRIIAQDLRRLAADLDLLGESGTAPEQLASLVGAVMGALGRPSSAVAVAPIVQAVCAAFRVTHEEMMSSRRGQHLALARQVAVYLVREITEYSFPRIAHYFGRDHSTAIHSHAAIARRVANEPSFRHLLEQLKTQAQPLSTQTASSPSVPPICGD